MDTTEAEMTRQQFRAWRHSLKISQREAGEKLGKSRRHIAAYEGGEYPVPISVVHACHWLSAVALAEEQGAAVPVTETSRETETGE